VWGPEAARSSGGGALHPTAGNAPDEGARGIAWGTNGLGSECLVKPPAFGGGVNIAFAGSSADADSVGPEVETADPKGRVRE